MNNPVRAVLLDMPHAALIWLLLVAFPVLVLGAVVGRTGWRLVRDWMRTRRPGRRARMVAQAREVIRYAEEVAVAAQRAAATAHRHRQQWLAALAAVQEASNALDAAEGRVRRLAEAAALPAPRTPRTPAEYADRERYLHRAAMATCTRGELSIYQLSDALAHHNGWDPRLHPVRQEEVLSRAVRDHLAAMHAVAVHREHAAWRATQAAAVAAHSLRDEALAAAWRVQRLPGRLRPRPEAAAEITQPLPQPRTALRWQTAHAR